MTHRSFFFQRFAAFQRSFSNDTDNGVHRDYPTYKYSAVLYLTPESSPSLGTSTWRHKMNGLYGYPTAADQVRRNVSIETLLEELLESPEQHKYDEIDRIGNRFNRLLIFNSMLNHRSSQLGGAGSSIDESRLVLILFFNSEDLAGQENSVLWFDSEP